MLVFFRNLEERKDKYKDEDVVYIEGLLNEIAREKLKATVGPLQKYTNAL